MRKLLLVNGGAIVAALALVWFLWQMPPPAPKLAALQLGELHLSQGNRAEALTCFFAAYKSNQDFEIRARCLEAAQEAATKAELVDLIDIDGELVDWWANDERTRLFAITTKGAVVYDLTNSTELGRQSFAAELEVYTVASNPGIPQWFAAAIKNEHVQIFQITDTGSCDLARQLQVRTLMGMRALGEPEHQRLAIFDNGIQVLDPAKKFDTEITIGGKSTSLALSKDGTLLAYVAGGNIRIRNLRTLLDDEIAIDQAHNRLLAFSDDASQLLVIAHSRVDIVDTISGEIVKMMKYDGSVSRMVHDHWLDLENEKFAVRDRDSVEYWDLEANNYVEITGRNIDLAWAMIHTGASVDEAESTQEWACEAGFFSESKLIQIGSSQALAQRSQSGFRLYKTPRGKLASGLPKENIVCFDWEPKTGELWLLDKCGVLTQQPIYPYRRHWELGRAKTLQLPVSNSTKLLVLSSGQFAVHRRDIPRIEVWRPSAAKVITHPQDHYQVMHANGRHVIKGRLSKTPTCVIDLEEGRVVRIFEGVNRDCCGLSSDGRYCLTQHRSDAFEGVEVRVVDTISGEILARKIVEGTGQSPSYRGVNQGERNGRLAFAGTFEGEWQNFVWDPGTNTFAALEEAMHRPFLVAGGDGLLAVPSSSGENFAYFWDLSDLGNLASSMAIKPVPIPFPRTFKKIVAAPNCTYLYLGADSGHVHIWNPVRGDLVAVRSLADHPEIKIADLYEIFVLPNGKGVLTTADSDDCQVWDMEMNTLRWQHNDPKWNYSEPIFSDDGELIFTASGGREPSFRAISTEDGSILAELQSGRHFKNAAFRPYTHQIAILTFDSIIIWDIDENTHHTIACEDRDGGNVYFDGEKVVVLGSNSLKIFPAAAESFDLETVDLRRKTGFHFVGGELKPMTRQEWKKSP